MPRNLHVASVFDFPPPDLWCHCPELQPWWGLCMMCSNCLDLFWQHVHKNIYEAAKSDYGSLRCRENTHFESCSLLRCKKQEIKTSLCVDPWSKPINWAFKRAFLVITFSSEYFVLVWYPHELKCLYRSVHACGWCFAVKHKQKILTEYFSQEKFRNKKNSYKLSVGKSCSEKTLLTGKDGKCYFSRLNVN